MAEEETIQTAGTVLERYGGMGTFYNPDHQAIADAVRSGELPRADVKTLTSFQLSSLGQKEYAALYPEVYSGGGLPQAQVMSPEAMEIAALRELRNSFIGLGMDIYRTMIDNRIASLVRQKRMGGWEIAREQEFPLPDWMRPLLGLPPVQAAEEDMGRGGFRKEQKQPTISAEEARELKLAPLGAQTELDVDQQKYLSSFLAWQKAGTPSGMGMGTVRGRTSPFMETLQRMSQGQGDWWAEFQRKSQSMFPSSQRLGVQRRVASQ